MNQGDLFTAPATITVVRSPLCAYARHCGAEAEIGPCDPSGEDCCNHRVRCQRCGQEGIESWNLTIGAKAHARQRPDSVAGMSQS